MNLLDAIVNAQNGAAVQQLGAHVGLPADQTKTALAALVPALAAGFQKNMQSRGGLESLMSALSSGNHSRYVDDPTSLNDGAAVADGNGILGHLLGSKEASREVAGRAATQTGLSPDILKRLLPLAATLMMGTFSKQSSGASPLGGSATGGGGIAAMLTPLLDSNRDGSVLDDVTSMIGRFTGKS